MKINPHSLQFTSGGTGKTEFYRRLGHQYDKVTINNFLGFAKSPEEIYPGTVDGTELPIGIDQIEIPVKQGDTLLSVLQQIEKKYFTPKNAQLLEETINKLTVGTLCLIDDADISLSGGLKQKINTSVTITLISSIHGG